MHKFAKICKGVAGFVSLCPALKIQEDISVDNCQLCVRSVLCVSNSEL